MAVDGCMVEVHVPISELPHLQYLDSSIAALLQTKAPSSLLYPLTHQRFEFLWMHRIDCWVFAGPWYRLHRTSCFQKLHKNHDGSVDGFRPIRKLGSLGSNAEEASSNPLDQLLEDYICYRVCGFSYAGFSPRTDTSVVVVFGANNLENTE